MKRTLQDVLRLCEEKEVKIIDFKMTDIDGRWRHLSIPVGRLNEDTMIYGIGFDGSNYGYAPVENSDMVFIPDLDSATIDPFAEVPTLTMIGDVIESQFKTAYNPNLGAALSLVMMILIFACIGFMNKFTDDDEEGVVTP